jgi:hypothetical protein
VSQRIDKCWVVLESLETEDGLRCVDLFRRPDGSFGYEEFRRDPEDRGAWTPVRFASGLRYGALELARAAARSSVVWLAELDNARSDASP